MSAPAAPSDSFRPDEVPLLQYRPLSRAAVGAFALGLASGLMLVSPLFIMAPLAALFVAVVAVRNTAHGGQVTGRGLAVAGLCLALLFAGWGLSRHFSRQARLASQAIELANGWLALVRAGDLPAAHQLTLNAARRHRSSAAVADYYRTSTDAAKAMHSYFESPLLAEFISQGKSAHFELVEVVLQNSAANSDEIVLKYLLAGPGGKLRPAWIVVLRSREPPATRFTWEFLRITPDPPAGLPG
ncbi:MAG: hypothetical protein SFU86_24305 [Pirellulaceae bacterium]|nr:hypothetical protein [Pirellulaceae bacterium]